MKLRIGTRTSPLAVAQCRLVAAELERIHPHLTTELVKVTERGDRDLSTPLHQVKDENFFNSVLDEALLNGRVDLCVHSFKDLARTRPTGIATAALPQRADPRDAILFHPRSLDKLVQGQPLIIGTCSVRRRRWIEPFLSWALPQQPRKPRLEFVDLRGPVDRRLEQLFVAREDGVTLDGAVLAVAGLSRLYDDPDGNACIAHHLKSLRWMVAPLSSCPTAPGQGALSIECRAGDDVTATLLAPLDHYPTRQAIAEEHRLLGPQPNPEDAATAVFHDELGLLRFAKHGADNHIKPSSTAFDATQLADYYHREAIPLPDNLSCAKAIYVAHHRCVTLQKKAWPDGPRVWVAGKISWRELAARGLWVEGCTDHLGFAAMVETLAQPVFRLPRLEDWVTVTHSDAVAGWRNSGVGRIVPTYRNRPTTLPGNVIESALASDHFFWTSPDQFKRLRQFVSPTATHATGPGKTATYLRKQGLQSVRLFHSRQAWQEWLA